MPGRANNTTRTRAAFEPVPLSAGKKGYCMMDADEIIGYQSWRNHASKGNSWHLLQRMDKYYQELWREQK